MVLSGDKTVASYDPNTGARHWIMDGPTEQFVASPVYNSGADLLFVTGGFPQFHIIAIDPHGAGNVTSTHIKWRTTRGASYVPSPISVGDYFFIVSDGGIASCFEANSGRQMWNERLSGDHHASVVSANGLVYFLSDKGVTTVIEAKPEFKKVAENLLGEQDGGHVNHFLRFERAVGLDLDAELALLNLGRAKIRRRRSHAGES
jgi:hypothetical protein